MPLILKLRGASALSEFRLAKLLRSLQQASPGVRRVAGEYWHFVEMAHAPDAEQRLIFLRNRMAAYENHVADYYLRRGAYIAALNRAKNALEEYNGSPGNAQSLKIMATAYEKLGMDDLAQDTRRVLAKNFPNQG